MARRADPVTPPYLVTLVDPAAHPADPVAADSAEVDPVAADSVVAASAVDLVAAADLAVAKAAAGDTTGLSVDGGA